MGHGADRVQALLNVWGDLKQNAAVADAIDCIAAEFTRRAGRAPDNSAD